MLRKISPIILILVSVGAFFAFIQPRYESLLKEKVLADEYADTFDNSTLLLNKRDDLLKEENNSFNPEDLVRLKKMLPDGVDNVRLILDIDGIANRYGLSIRNTRVGQDISTAGGQGTLSSVQPYGSISLSFSVSASYATFLKFLNDLERSLRLVDIVSLQVKADRPDFYNFDIVLKTYWLKK